MKPLRCKLVILVEVSLTFIQINYATGCKNRPRNSRNFEVLQSRDHNALGAFGDYLTDHSFLSLERVGWRTGQGTYSSW